MQQNPYAAFSTDTRSEVTGVWINYGDFRVLVARAGGANEAYNLALDRKARAMRRTGVTSAKRLEALALELLAEYCIKDWQVKNDAGNFMPGITMPDGENDVFNIANVQKVFKAYPDLARALLAEASSLELFQEEQLEEESGN